MKAEAATGCVPRGAYFDHVRAEMDFNRVQFGNRAGMRMNEKHCRECGKYVDWDENMATSYIENGKDRHSGPVCRSCDKAIMDQRKKNTEKGN